MDIKIIVNSKKATRQIDKITKSVLKLQNQL